VERAILLYSSTLLLPLKPLIWTTQATDMDYFITNVSSSIVTPQWIVDRYSQRNWLEVFTGKPRDG
jgi:hypothetical protein